MKLLLTIITGVVIGGLILQYHKNVLSHLRGAFIDGIKYIRAHRFKGWQILVYPATTFGVVFLGFGAAYEYRWLTGNDDWAVTTLFVLTALAGLLGLRAVFGRN